MPRAIKLFLVLCFVYSVWLVWTNVGFLLFPSPEHLKGLDKLGDHWKAIAERADLVAGTVRTLIALTLFITFALLAGLKRKNWARWALVVFIIATLFFVFLREGIIMMLISADLRASHIFWNAALHGWISLWSQWQTWAILALKLALIATIFSPSVKEWFGRLAQTHQD